MALPAVEPPWEFSLRCEIGGSGDLWVTEADPRLAARVGIAAGELETAGGWTRLVPPRDIGPLLRAIEGLREGRIRKGRVRMLTKSGEPVILDVRAVPSERPEGGVSVAVQATDVTEIVGLESRLAESRSALRLLDGALSIAMWITDTDLRFTRSWGSLLGEENSLVGSSLYDWFDLSEPDIPPISAHQAALRGETASYVVEWGGRQLRVEVEPLVDRSREIAGVVGIGVDLDVLTRIGRVSKSPEVVRAQHERLHPPPDAGFRSGVLSVAGLVIDGERFEVRKDGRLIPLTVIEFKLLTELALHQGSPLSREVLAERVWGHPTYADSPAVTMAISRLRDKVEEDPTTPKIIETVRGVGYRIADDRGVA